MYGGDSVFGRMTSKTHVYSDTGVDAELDHRSHRVTDKLSESINTIANEPSVAFYRIQEHVRKTLPQLVEQKHEVEEVQQLVQGACFDTEYAGNAVKGMEKSVVHFQNIQELLKNAMFMKQQIDYEEARKEDSQALVTASGKEPTEREDTQQDKDGAEREQIQEKISAIESEDKVEERDGTDREKDTEDRREEKSTGESEEKQQAEGVKEQESTQHSALSPEDLVSNSDTGKS